MKISNSFMTITPQNNNKINFGSGEAKLLTDILSDRNVNRSIITLKEFDLVKGIDFNKERFDYTINIVKKLQEQLSGAIIPESFDKEIFNSKEAKKINSIVKNDMDRVFPGDEKGDYARAIQKSLKQDIDGILEEEGAREVGNFFRNCFSNVVRDIRILQRTLGFPDNYHLKKSADLAKVKGNFNELI